MARITFNWYEVYHELALLLKKFHDRHKSRSGQLLYKAMISNQVVKAENPWLQNIDRFGKDKCIDPFHFFTSFNQYNESESKRIKIINEYFQILDDERHFDLILFKGCPSPFALKILSVRDKKTQNEIWNKFNEFISKSREALSNVLFLQIEKWYGINIASLSIFLFWIDAKNFISLDKNSQEFLSRIGVIKTPVKEFAEYQRLLPEQNSDLYIKIAELAITDKGASEGEQAQLRVRFNARKAINRTSFDFKIIAIEPTIRIHMKLLKNLDKKSRYVFYKQYNFRRNNTIENLPNKSIPDLYSSKILQVNISAIVGKNGSGKSTISELMFLAINNISATALATTEVDFEPGLHLNVYFHSNTINKIELRGNHIYFIEYQYKENIYTPTKRRKINPDDARSFFYTIAINYSFYSLNSKELGPWIERLFHKNDGYQTPIVLNPLRFKGNIDVNRENDLVKQRIFSNVLEKVDIKDKYNLRRITDNGRFLQKVKFRIDKEKGGSLSSAKVVGGEEIFKSLKGHFGFSTTVSRKDLIPLAKKYLVSKTLKIANQYTQYKGYLDYKGNLKLSTLDEYLDRLAKDNSHITYKLRQAINFFKYDTCKYVSLSGFNDIEKMSQRIDVIKSENHDNREIKTIELIPPAFLEFDLFLSDGSDFKDLSSGEKQKINTVSTVMYHLNNLDSVAASSKLVSYQFVNVIFDEVELYFHPDMQRTFVSYLLSYFRKATFSNISAINLCFITHSPFILSDISNSNILYLSTEGKPDNTLNECKTFAGNIHDLLGNNFYLANGYMGDFATELINKIIKYLNVTIARKKSISIEWKDTEVLQIIKLIGEPLLRESLIEMYDLAFPKTAINQSPNALLI